MKLSLLVSLACLLALAGCFGEPNDIRPAGESFFPLAVGNRWVFVRDDASGQANPVTRDTMTIVARTRVRGGTYYHVHGNWPGFAGEGVWLRRQESGNVLWSRTPGAEESLFLQFDAEVGQRWPLASGFTDCLNSLQLLDDYAIVNAPYGRFDGARQIGGGWVDCTDFGWTVEFARGVGPVSWEAISLAGPTHWLLLEAHIEDEPAAQAGRSRVIDGD